MVIVGSIPVLAMRGLASEIRDTYIQSQVDEYG